MTKCLSLFGLGLYIYAGEDLPEDGEEEKRPEPPKEVPKKTPPGTFPLYTAKELLAGETKATTEQKEELVILADELLMYLEEPRTKAQLTAHWKANQTKIDEIKVKLPDLHDIVRRKFTEAKERANG